MNRTGAIERKTTETDIKVNLDIDGTGISEINVPIPFLKHMLESFSRHSCFDLKIEATGDIENDPHHLIEDIGICLGSAFSRCIGNKEGINRFGFAIIPMDESQVTVSLDIGGRPFLRYDVDIINEKIMDMKVRLFEDFFRAFSVNASINLHIAKNSGINSHHIIEAVFKAFAVAMKTASGSSGKKIIPSTKGLI
jgi:imidazoleglycerol-phosphate dehydratase